MKKRWQLWDRESKGLWYVRFPGQGWKSTGIRDREQAEAWAERNCPDRPVDHSMTLAAFAVDFFVPGRCRWLKRQEAKGRRPRLPYIIKQRSLLDNYILPRFGKAPVRDITRRQVDDWLLDLKSKQNNIPLGADAKNKIIMALRTILADAADIELIDRNPLEGLSLFRDQVKKRREVFTPDELATLFPVDLDALLDIWGTLPWAAYFFLMASCGLRPGEVSALNWSDWHRSQHGLVIGHSIEAITLERKTTKTGSSRAAPLTRRAETYLLLIEAQSLTTEPTDRIFNTERKKVNHAAGRYDIIRGPITLAAQGKHFAASLSRAKVTANGRTPYCLRHSFDTHMLRDLSVGDVQKLMGHSTPQHTLGTYYHPEDGDLVAAVPDVVRAKIETLYGG
jgi:integrase